MRKKMAKKNLYKVTVVCDILVMAKDSKDAVSVAYQVAEDEIGNVFDSTQGPEESITVERMIHANDLPKPWQNSIPWGSTTDETCAEIMMQDREDE
jgi:hypothetical protein